MYITMQQTELYRLRSISHGLKNFMQQKKILAQ